MRVVVQRSGRASVEVDQRIVGSISHGLVLLVGIKSTDTDANLSYMADKVAHLRIFEDEDGKMNLDILAVGGQILSISQFTLYSDVRKGRRPNYMDAAPPEMAMPMYERFIALLRDRGIQVETGVFGAKMSVSLVNEGPVTILLDSERVF